MAVLVHAVGAASGVVVELFLGGVAVEGVVEEGFDLLVAEGFAFEVAVGVADVLGVGKIDVHRVLGVEVIGVVAQSGVLLVAELHAGGVQGLVVLVDGDEHAAAGADLGDPLGVVEVVRVGGDERHVVEDESLAEGGAGVEQVLVEVVAHAVEHEVDGVGALLLGEFGEAGVAGLAVFFVGFPSGVEDALAAGGGEAFEILGGFGEGAVEGADGLLGRGFVVAVVEDAGAAGVGGPAEGDDLDAVAVFEAHGAANDVGEVVVEAVDEEQEVAALSAGAALLLGLGGRLRQDLMSDVDAAVDGVGRVEAHAFEPDVGDFCFPPESGGQFVGDELNLGLLRRAGDFDDAEFVGGFAIQPVGEKGQAGFRGVDFPVGDNEHWNGLRKVEAVSDLHGLKRGV